jgi:hypothetical protein
VATKICLIRLVTAAGSDSAFVGVAILLVEESHMVVAGRETACTATLLTAENYDTDWPVKVLIQMNSHSSLMHLLRPTEATSTAVVADKVMDLTELAYQNQATAWGSSAAIHAAKDSVVAAFADVAAAS